MEDGDGDPRLEVVRVERGGDRERQWDRERGQRRNES